jgi:hypothetical protein
VRQSLLEFSGLGDRCEKETSIFWKFSREADATENTLRSLLSVSIIQTKQKGADSQMQRTRPPERWRKVVVVKLTAQLHGVLGAGH